MERIPERIELAKCWFILANLFILLSGFLFATSGILFTESQESMKQGTSLSFENYKLLVGGDLCNKDINTTKETMGLVTDMSKSYFSLSETTANTSKSFFFWACVLAILAMGAYLFGLGGIWRIRWRR